MVLRIWLPKYTHTSSRYHNVCRASVSLDIINWYGDSDMEVIKMFDDFDTQIQCEELSPYEIGALEEEQEYEN